MIYAIGDIHGHRERMEALLSNLERGGMAAADTLVFVGDYVDRGPDSAGVIQRLIELKASRPNTVLLRGNHEQMMLDARQRFEPSFDAANVCGNIESGVFWFVEGGQETMKSYGPLNGRRWFEAVPDDHWRFLRETAMEFESSPYLFVHAGVLPAGAQWEMPDFPADPRLWIRYPFIASESDFNGRTVVFGHTPTRDGRPMRLANKVAIDTGVAYGGPLTAVGLPSEYDPEKVVVFQT